MGTQLLLEPVGVGRVRRDAMISAGYKAALALSLLGALTLPVAAVETSVTAFANVHFQEQLRSFGPLQQTIMGLLPEDQHDAYGVLGTIRTLASTEQWLPALLVAIGSVLLPVAKTVARLRPALTGRFWKTLRLVAGRFALLDVLVVAVLVVAMSPQAGLTVSLGPAAWFYLAFALLYGLPPRSVAVR